METLKQDILSIIEKYGFILSSELSEPVNTHMTFEVKNYNPTEFRKNTQFCEEMKELKHFRHTSITFYQNKKSEGGFKYEIRVFLDHSLLENRFGKLNNHTRGTILKIVRDQNIKSYKELMLFFIPWVRQYNLHTRMKVDGSYFFHYNHRKLRYRLKKAYLRRLYELGLVDEITKHRTTHEDCLYCFHIGEYTFHIRPDDANFIQSHDPLIVGDIVDFEIEESIVDSLEEDYLNHPNKYEKIVEQISNNPTALNLVLDFDC